MPRATPPTPTPFPPSGTTHLFGQLKPAGRNDRGALMTSAHIAEDLARFQREGGRIEVLGNTRMLTRIDADADADAPAPRPDATTPRR